MQYPTDGFTVVQIKEAAYPDETQVWVIDHSDGTYTRVTFADTDNNDVMFGAVRALTIVSPNVARRYIRI